MIANAHRADDGTYSDHGALTLSVGELFVQHIYDYDHGYTLGAAISTIAFMPTIGGRDGEGETLSTLGGGKVKCTTEGGACETEQTNREVANPQTWTQHYDIDPITPYIPIEPLPNLPKTPEGEVDWDKVNKNLENQVNTLFKDLINIFADNKVEEIPLPKTDNCQDDAAETRDVKDEDPTKKAKEEFIKALREELEKQFGKEEAARLARIGMHRASELIGSLESLDPKNYVVDGDKIIIALPKKGVIKAGTGQGYMEVAFDIVTAEAAKQAEKGVVKVGKYFVRVNPYVLATLTAYEIGSYVYENREDIALKLGEVTEFAKQMVDNARDTSRQKTKQDLAGNYGFPNPDPDDWEPDDFDPEKAKYKDAPYHHKNSQGLKSPAPKDPINTLRDSLKYSENSPNRVGVDVKNQEFVVFSRTEKGLYHGHVRSWEQLTDNMKNVLRDARLVRPNGKIK